MLLERPAYLLVRPQSMPSAAKRCLWMVRRAAEIERLVYPRACALAEVVWSPPASRDFARFAARLTLSLIHI